MTDKIILKNISQNNLKNFDLEIPKNKLIVVTGVSGSGKSSLAFDVINKEGQRRYFTNFSAGARKYLGKLQKADVESIENLSPTISLSQKTKNNNPRSTVGTISEIYDYLRLLFARVGESDFPGLKINRSLFSFNSLTGACKYCNGLGVEDVISPKLLIDDATKTIRNQALKITNPNGYTIYSQVTIDALNEVCNAHGFNVDIPWQDLSDEQKNIVLNGSDKIKILYGKHTLESRMKWSGITVKPREKSIYKGILPVMNEILIRDRNPNILRFAKTQICSHCNGNRLSAEALSVKISDKNISELSELSLDKLVKFIHEMRNFAKVQNFGKIKVVHEISSVILQRIETLQELGLGYLSLSRSASSLSGGETQRIRLSQQVNSKLRNIIFVFDEPSIGVHLSNNQSILKIIRKLVDNGNTAIIVEHDAQTILSADWIIDIGPKAGKNGGELLFNGKLEDFLLSEHQSITKDYLNKKKEIKLDFKIPSKAEYFSIKNAEINNLKNINVDFKYGNLNVVCGVSGAGKSSLINQTLITLIRDEYQKQINTKGQPFLQNFKFKKTITVNQSPIGKTARSTPATYTKLHDLIRNFYANLEESKKRKFTKSTFSFNVKGGSCKKCGGAGKLEIGMHFLGNVETICNTCNGKRYNAEVLSVKFNDKSISDVLNLSVKEAILFFEGEKKILKSLQILDKIGLGYIKLGQSSNSLSGGEAQRIKLATELIKANSSQTLFIFDEPTTGLHFYDIQILMDLFAELLKKGNTIIVIEHNEDLIKNAQHLIELGPNSGNLGGKLIYSGDFEGFSKCSSLTAQAIKSLTNLALTGFQTLSGLCPENISFKGITTNNLKNIDIQIPYNQHTVIVGKSGSGKSSLAFDTLFVEAQNRFTESFPAYARRFATYNSKAKFEQVSGLTPVIALRQNNKINDSRSTLATLTEIYDLYRLLFSRFGTAFCSDCGEQLADNYCKKCEKEFLKTNTASIFSFNNSEGSCTECSGLGKVLTSSATKLVENWDLSFAENALKKNKTIRFFTDKNGQYIATLLEVGKQFGFDYSQPLSKLSKEALNKAFFGTDDREYSVQWKFKGKTNSGTHSFTGKWTGFVQLILDEYFQKQANGKGSELLEFLHEKECPKCKGQKYKKEILSVKFNEINIFELSQKSVAESFDFFESVSTLPKFTQLNNSNENINVGNLQTSTLAKFNSNSQIFENIFQKLNALKSFGLEYLSLNRFSKTLSGGELQRALLSTHLTGNLTGITYILDEPSTGLHPSDVEMLSENIKKIVNIGNTVVTVEHNPEIIKNADNIIEIGPEAGENGGELVYSGSFKEYLGFLSDSEKVPHFKGARGISLNEQEFLKINSANANNLKNIDVKIALNSLNVISGVSGSGKTSLMRDVLLETFNAKSPQFCKSMDNLERLDSVIWIDKNGLEKNQISTPATFLGIFDEIRKLFSQTPSAKAKKLKAADFSYNGKSGQCPVCKGQGEIKHSLDFMSDVKTTCEECNGKRFKAEILEIFYESKTIFDVLEMSLLEVLNFFHKNKKITQVLKIVDQFGLGYIKLGQSSKDLSGGESQRFKIAKELTKSKTTNNLYIFDEASRGLHTSDLKYLLSTFEFLLRAGNTVIAIEHNTNIIAEANWIIDLGIGGGEKGGKLVFQGVLSDLLKCKESKTAKYIY